MAQKLKPILLAALCGLISAPASAEDSAQGGPQEGVVIAILGDSHRVDLIQGQAIIFKPENGKMTFIRFVEGPMEPGAGEVKLELGGLGGKTSLIATSRADKAYGYRAEILKKLGAKKGKPTSVCTIIAGGSAIESWPREIPYLRISDFKAVPDGQIGCP